MWDDLAFLNSLGAGRLVGTRSPQSSSPLRSLNAQKFDFSKKSNFFMRAAGARGGRRSNFVLQAQYASLPTRRWLSSLRLLCTEECW
jgi:hypothetical protein